MFVSAKDSATACSAPDQLLRCTSARALIARLRRTKSPGEEKFASPAVTPNGNELAACRSPRASSSRLITWP